MSAEQTPDIAAVLAEHATVATGLGEWCCKCSPMTWRPTVHRATHVAAALAPVLAAAVREAEQRALREAADALEPIIWTDPNVAAWLRDRADRITEPVSHEAATSGEEASKA